MTIDQLRDDACRASIEQLARIGAIEPETAEAVARGQLAGVTAYLAGRYGRDVVATVLLTLADHVGATRQ